MIGMLVESRRYGGLQQFHVLDCIECGSCAFACPACRPLVQLLRQGKAVVRKARDPKALAPKA